MSSWSLFAQFFLGSARQIFSQDLLLSEFFEFFVVSCRLFYVITDLPGAKVLPICSKHAYLGRSSILDRIYINFLMRTVEALLYFSQWCLLTGQVKVLGYKNMIQVLILRYTLHILHLLNRMRLRWTLYNKTSRQSRRLFCR